MNNTLSLVTLALLPNLALAQYGDETHKVIASDYTNAKLFGRSVDISGSRAIVGAMWSDTTSGGEGAAYVYDVSTGLELHKLLPLEVPELRLFGCSVAIESSTAIVGAMRDDGLGYNAGAAYLFDPTSGLQTQALRASDGQANDLFGAAVDIDGNLAIVGAPTSTTSPGGAVYVFNVTTGQQIRKLTPNDPFAGFGQAVALFGNTAIIGSPTDDDFGQFSGSAYLFDVATGVQLAKLLPSNGQAGDYFGLSVGLNGTTAVVGSRSPSLGGAYLFDIATGNQTHDLSASVTTYGLQEFGSGVAISANQVLVGAWKSADAGQFSGSAFLFDATTGHEIAKFLPSDGGDLELFGSDVALDSGMAIIGASGEDELPGQDGAAYLIPTDYVGTGYCQTGSNSTGQPAKMSSQGSTSLSAGNFSLRARPVPNTPYMFFYGSSQVEVPFGDGLLCVGGSLVRIGQVQTAAANVATLDVNLGTAGITSPGTHNFQCWFRDPSGGLAGFNFSNGLAVTFQP